MELESVKGPAMASCVQEHTAAQMQRMSIGLLDAAAWEAPLLRRMSALQVGLLAVVAATATPLNLAQNAL